MIYFLLIYSLVYGGVNFFLFREARRALPPSAFSGSLLAVFLLAMVAAPILAHLLETRHLASPARAVAVVGYCWMAAAFWLFLLFLARDLWNLLVGFAGSFFAAAGRLVIPPGTSAVIFMAVVIAAGLWGAREANDIRLRTITVTSPHLPHGTPPLRVAFISDVHVDLLVGESKLRKIAGLAEEAHPDLLICGGDLLDASAEQALPLAPLLASLRPPLGKFAILGNHEYYAGIKESERFIADAGFRLLRGESLMVGDRLLLAGVDDPAGRQFGVRAADEESILPSEASRPAVVLIKHRPKVAEDSIGRFDLQLSGHTHGGQIFPWGLFVALQYPAPDGLSDAGRGSRLYKGRGTGTWGPPLRVLAPPEVTLVILSPEK